MTHAEIRRYLASVDPYALRVRAGISAATIARAIGTSGGTVRGWESRGRRPQHPAWVRYARVVQGLARHAEIGRF